MATRRWAGTSTTWAADANWAGGTTPTAGDTIYLIDSTQAIGAQQIGGTVTFDVLVVDQSMTGTIGSTAVGTSSYLQIPIAIGGELRIGGHEGPGTPNGSSLIKINTIDNAGTIIVENSGSPSDTSKPPVYLLANNTSATIEVRKGTVGIAYDVGEVAVISSLGTSFVTNKNSDAKVYVGSGVTLDSVNQDGGVINLGSDQAITSGITIDAGTMDVVGSGAITTINQRDGTANYKGTGTITTLNLSGGFADFTKSQQARTVSNLNLDASGRISYDPDIVTISALAATKPVTLSAI